MAPPASRIHKLFKKYVTDLNPWTIRDLNATSDQRGEGKKQCDRFRAVRESIPPHERRSSSVKFSVFVIFIPSHPDSPPDFIFPNPNDNDLYDREFDSLSPEQWVKNGDRALFLLLEELYEAHKDAQRALFLSLADQRVSGSVQLALEREGLCLFVSGRPDDQELWLSIPVDLHKRTIRYISSQLPDKDINASEFILDVCWKANRKSAVPHDQYLRWSKLFDEFIGDRLKRQGQIPQWRQRDDVFEHCEEVAGTIEKVIGKHEKDFDVRKQFVESLTKELCVRKNAMIPQLSSAPLCRPHEYDSVRYTKCSFYFIAGKKEHPLIVSLDMPTFPIELPTIEVQAQHLFDRNQNPLRDELAIYQPHQCTVEQLISNIRGRIQKRVPQILNELEKRHVKAREERAQQLAQPEGKTGGDSKSAKGDNEGQPRGSQQGDVKSQQGSSAQSQGDAKSKEANGGGGKSQPNGSGQAASNGAESSPSGGGGASVSKGSASKGNVSGGDGARS